MAAAIPPIRFRVKHMSAVGRRKEHWRFHILRPNNKIIEPSEGYPRESIAWEGVEATMKGFADLFGIKAFPLKDTPLTRDSLPIPAAWLTKRT